MKRLIVMLSLALAAFISLNATAANEARTERVPIWDAEPYVSETYKKFSDVSEHHWCKDGISYVVDNGFFAGTDRGTFEPEMATSRAMLCTVLYRLAGEPDVRGTTEFADTKDGEWYEKGVVWAKQNEIFPDWVMASPNLDPNGVVNRGEFAVMLRNYYEYKGGSAFNDGMHGIATLFPDIQMDEHSYLIIPAVSWLYTYSILTGTIDNKMATDEPFTRSQLAAMLMRYDMQFGRETPRSFGL